LHSFHYIHINNCLLLILGALLLRWDLCHTCLLSMQDITACSYNRFWISLILLFMLLDYRLYMSFSLYRFIFYTIQNLFKLKDLQVRRSFQHCLCIVIRIVRWLSNSLSKGLFLLNCMKERFLIDFNVMLELLNDVLIF
jgi:hypothetical protein